jgi:hypothetical protein
MGCVHVHDLDTLRVEEFRNPLKVGACGNKERILFGMASPSFNRNGSVRYDMSTLPSEGTAGCKDTTRLSDLVLILPISSPAFLASFLMIRSRYFMRFEWAF